jgi:gliding motility-associated-like protein
MEIGTSGNLIFDISQVNGSGSGIDVDFILYGPYTDLANAQSYCGNMGNGTPNNSVVDCSYAPAPQETATLNGAIAGEVYMILITNFSNQTGNITFQQTGGTGATDCSIVNPPCPTVGIHVEDAGGNPFNFPISLDCDQSGWMFIRADDMATAGGIIVPAVVVDIQPTNANGSGNNLYGYENNPPWNNYWGVTNIPSTSNYTFTMLEVDNVTTSQIGVEMCDVLAGTNMPYTITDAACGGVITTGTWTASGGSAGPNGSPSSGGCQFISFPSSSVGGSAVYTCPTCPPGSFSVTDYGHAFFNPSIAGPGSYDVTYCFDNGCAGAANCQGCATETITVNNPYTATGLSYPTPVCSNSPNISPTLTGTAGGTYSSTAGLSINGSTGEINVGTSTPATYTITYTVGTLPCGATVNTSVTILPDVNPAWTNPSPICAAAGSINLNSLITGTSGGTWSGTGVSGTTFNPASGTQSVTYTVGTAPCQETFVQTITVNPDVDPSWTNPSAICASAGSINLNSLITGTSGGTWSGTGVSGTTFNPASGTQSVTYTVGTVPCQEISSQTITVIPDVDPAWTNPSPICAAAGSINLNSLITGTPGGTWSGTGVSGTTFNPASGTQSVTYTVGTAPCQETSIQTITVNPDVDPSWTNPSTICANAGSINLNTLITGTVGGTWSGTGVSGNTFDPTGLSGNIAVTYTVGTAPCQETLVQNINVVPDVDPSWAPPASACENTGSINLNTLITGTAGGTWSGTGVTGTNFDPTGLSGNIAITYTVGTAPCIETSVQNINVIPDVDPTWTPPSPICANAGSISLTPLVSGTAGGTWSGTGVTGTNFDPTGLSGNISITYTVGTAPCTEFFSQNINVIPDVNPTWTNPGPVCEGVGSISLNPLVTGTMGGTWSGTGVSGTNFDPTGLSGNILVTYNVGTAPCQESLALNIQVDAEDDPSFSYPSGTYCLTGSDPIATVLGTTGGTFIISGTGVINAGDGTIDLSASGLGTFTVTYNTTTAGNPCPNSTTFSITITSAPSAAFSYDAPTYCQDAVSPILTYGPGASGGQFTTSPLGLSINAGTGVVDLIASTPGIYTVYNTILPSGGCAAALDSTTIEILQMDSALFSYSPMTFCITGTNPVANITGTTGGTFMISSPGVILNPLTGEIDLSASGLGTFTVYYNTPAINPCPALDSVVINIVNAPEATFTYNTPFCEGDTSTVMPSFGANSFAGIFSSNPAGVSFVNTTTGQIDLTTSAAGTYTIYNDIVPANGCAAAIDSFEVVVNPIYTIPINAAICQGDSIMLGGTYQTTAGVYNDSLITVSGCDSILQTTLSINPVIITSVSAAICQGDSVLLGGTYQTAAGIYNDSLMSSTGCDSILQTTLTINTVILTSINDSICQGDSILLGGAYQTTDGVYNDTVLSVGGCDSVIATSLIVNPLNTIVPDPFTPICSNTPISLSATGSGTGVVTWYSDAGGLTIIGTGSPLVLTNPSPGIYTYYVNDVGACSSNIDSVIVVVGGVTAVINATPITGAIPLSVSLDGTGSTGAIVGYQWDFDEDGIIDDTQGSTSTIYSSIGTYNVMLIVSDGICSDTAYVLIDAFGESVVLIPNVFTPNGDGSNDIFTVEGVNLESVEGEIFNRWGQKVFSWNNVKGHWDGRTLSGSEAPDGTYFYIINAKGFDGEEYFKKGGFSLIR